MNVVAVVIAVIIVALIVIAAQSIRVVTQYEKGVLFRLGRVKDVREPGLTFIIPVIDRLRKVSMRIITMPIQSQGIITRDNVSVDIAAVAYFRVVDAVKSVVVIENVGAAIDQIAQTTLRNVVGQHTLDETLADTEVINANIRQILDVITLEWGVEIVAAGRGRRRGVRPGGGQRRDVRPLRQEEDPRDAPLRVDLDAAHGVEVFIEVRSPTTSGSALWPVRCGATWMPRSAAYVTEHLDVGGVDRESDRRRLLVERAVVRLASGVPAGMARLDQGTAELVAQVVGIDRAGERRHRGTP